MTNFRLKQAVLGLATSMMVFVFPVNANPLDSDQKPLFPGFQSAQDAANLPQNLLGDGDRKFLILEIDNIEGNDPFDEQQPFLNFGGERVESVEDLLALINGAPPPVDPPPPPTGGGCSPSTIDSDSNGTITVQIFSTGGCQLLSNSSGNSLFIQSTEEDVPFSIGTVFVNATDRPFTLLTPPDFQGAFFDFFNEDVSVLQIQEVATGTIFTFNISLQFTGAVSANGSLLFTLTVFSFESSQP